MESRKQRHAPPLHPSPLPQGEGARTPDASAQGGCLLLWTTPQPLNPNPQPLLHADHTSPTIEPGQGAAHPPEDADGHPELACSLPLGTLRLAARADAAEPD